MKKLFLLVALALFPLFAKTQNLCPDSRHPHMIDLGLPSGTKWACCNVGALKPEGYGNFFAWGETSTKSTYDYKTYRWFKVEGYKTMFNKRVPNIIQTKYNINDFGGTLDYKTQLDLSDDAARAKWHGSWRMPTVVELEELKANCNYEWTTVNGVKGGKFTSRSNGRSIFLPAAGERDGASHSGRGDGGLYWSSSLSLSDKEPYELYINSKGAHTNSRSREYGQSVRPVVSTSSLCPDDRHPHVIDLGLPSGTKWACCNVGSLTPEDYGKMYAWGETSTKAEQRTLIQAYDWSTYSYGGSSELTKYNNDSSYGTVDNKTQLDLSDDAARANWHGSWRMPSEAELEELKANCSYEWTTVNGVKGCKFTSRSNGRSVFLPAAGRFDGFSFISRGENGSYWTLSLDGVNPNNASNLYFDSSRAGANKFDRSNGLSVRPVLGNPSPLAISFCPDGNHPHVIDLGLPSGTKWACCNVGSSKPEDYGSFFSWGETSTKSTYDWNTYRWCNGNEDKITKYNTKSRSGTVDNRTQLELSDDAARAYWHGSWRMPTRAEMEELKAYCSFTWTAVNGIKGVKFTSRSTGRSIFLPAAGFRNGASLKCRGEGGVYWSSSLDGFDESCARSLGFDSDGSYAVRRDRADGQSVRPVLSPPPTPATQPATTSLCPDSHHPHMIDLGLPSGTKWACCNVGSSKPEDYGVYYAWGETNTKSTYDWRTYRWCKGSSSTLTKYNTKSSYGTVDRKTQLDFADDAASANWHGSWRMPTLAELEELKDNCTYTWTTINGIIGGKFTSRSNGRSIFLPAAGWRNSSSLEYSGEHGFYRSSSLYGRNPSGARSLEFFSVGALTTSLSRDDGQSVRPVAGNP